MTKGEIYMGKKKKEKVKVEYDVEGKMKKNKNKAGKLSKGNVIALIVLAVLEGIFYYFATIFTILPGT